MELNLLSGKVYEKSKESLEPIVPPCLSYHFGSFLINVLWFLIENIKDVSESEVLHCAKDYIK